MNRDEYRSNIADILKYSGNYSSTEITSFILASDTQKVKEAFGEHPKEMDDPNVLAIASKLMSVMPGIKEGTDANAKFSHETINEFLEFMRGAVTTENKLLIQESIRITPLGPITSDVANASYIINNPTIYYGDGMEMSSDTEEFTLKSAAELDCVKNFTTTNESPTKQKPKCVVIELLKPGLGASARDTKEVSIFANMVTPLEMSRCVPFMRLRVIPPKYIDNQQQQVRMPAYFNIIGFLKGDKSPLDLSAMGAADAALSVTMGADGEVDGGGSMELFTTPQTMMTTRGNLGKFSNKILDRSRPFMSVTGVKISVKPAGGWYSFKTATIDLVLHDRSRLGEIAPFIKPDIFAGANKTTFEIEYGWSHPDGNKKVGDRFKNPIGTFLNGLRCLENYEVYNATYSFADAGQVNISLQLSMKSHSSILSQSPTITEIKDAITALESLTKDINAKMKALTGENDSQKNSLKEVFPEILMNGAANADAAMSMDLTKFDELQRKINDITTQSTDKTKDLSLAISALLTKAKDAQKNSSSKTDAKITALKRGKEIFPAFVGDNLMSPPTRITIPPTISKVTKDTISLGRIMYSFVAAPLAATNEFAEVQLIFGLHNDRASFMRSLSIARHPIDSEAFTKEVTEFMKKHARMTINEFMGMLNEKFITNTAAFAHGFSGAQPAKAKNGEQNKEDIKNYDIKAKIITDDAKILDGNYRPPNLQVTTECVKASNGDPILRIFVFDSNATVHQTYVDMLRSARDVSSNVVNLSAIDPVHPMLPRAPEVRNLAKSKEALKNWLLKKGALTGASKESKPSPSTSDQAVKVSAMALVEDASKLKSIISKGLPYIRYGQGSGAITSIGASSLSDPGLANAALSAAGQGTTYASSNADQYRGIPMRIAPADLSIEMLGCPTLSLMQNFFIDLDTNTTLDGIYTISGVEHSLSPGSFSTSIKLINTSDGYMSFRSAGNELSSTISRWLQEDPDAKAATQKADEKRKAEAEKRAAAAKSSKESADKKAKDAAEKSAYERGIETRAEELRTQAEYPMRKDIYRCVESWGKALTTGEGRTIESKFIDALQAMNNSIPLTDRNGNLYKFTRAAPLGKFCWYIENQYLADRVPRGDKQFNAYEFQEWLSNKFVSFIQENVSISPEDLSTIGSGIRGGFIGESVLLLGSLEVIFKDIISSKYMDEARKEAEEKSKQKA